MFTISEFSKMSNTSIQTLRYYDNLDLLKPSLIGKFNNYRYYSTKELIKSKIIKKFKRMGFSLKDILNLLNKYDEKYLIQQKNKLQNNIDNDLNSIKEIDGIIKKLNNKNTDFTKELINLINIEERSKINMKEKYDNAKEKLMQCYKAYQKDNIEDCLILLEELKNDIFEADDEVSPFWIVSAGDLFTGIVFEIFKHNKPEDVTFLNIFQFKINGKEIIENMTEYVDSLAKDSYSYISLSSISNAPIETRGGIVATFKQKMKIYTMFESKK